MMLQKIYWLGHIQSEHINTTQEIRNLFCKHEFPHLTFASPAFAMVGGGLVSNAYTWTLVINNCSIFLGAGSVITSVDKITEQIRLFMILRMNLFFGKSPEEVENHCNTLRSVESRKILPEVFSDTSRPLHEEIEGIAPWFQKVLSLPRQKYLTVCQVLTAYERALHVLSSDPALSYCLLVFVVEALANSHSDYHATWDDVRGQPRKHFDTLFEDERISSYSIEDSWTEDLREAIVDVLHPGATRRFTQFALDHIPKDFYNTSQSTAKFPLRRSRICQSIQNAYVLRSSFSHTLTPLTQFLIEESHAEEVELDSQTYLTLRGLFRLVRSIVLEFIEQQEIVELYSHPWHEESHDGLVRLPRVPAYLRMKTPEGQLSAITAQYAQNWFEDILTIYQDNYIERLHEHISSNQGGNDLFMGIATSGFMAGRVIFRFDPSPSYDWKSLKEQSLSLTSQAKKIQKGYLQAIALLCAHLETMDSGYEKWDAVMTARTFDTPLLELERFVVDVIHDKTQHWSGEQAEKIFERHLKKSKVFLPTRVEIACMLELAKLYKREGSDEGRQKWLKAAYGDTALYSSLQSLIQHAMNSDDIVVEPQEALSIAHISSEAPISKEE
jgi:hypothetical protein